MGRAQHYNLPLSLSHLKRDPPGSACEHGVLRRSIPGLRGDVDPEASCLSSSPSHRPDISASREVPSEVRMASIGERGEDSGGGIQTLPPPPLLPVHPPPPETEGFQPPLPPSMLRPPAGWP